MNTIPSLKKETPGTELIAEQIPEAAHPFPHEINITDGGEFLDDGIRMKDQPFGGETGKENE